MKGTETVKIGNVFQALIGRHGGVPLVKGTETLVLVVLPRSVCSATEVSPS